MIENIKWLRHACFKIKTDKVIYIDPYELPSDAEKADLILVTHDHFDHLSPGDVKKVQKEGTTIVTPPGGAGKLKGDVRTVRRGEKLSLGGVEVEAVPAYNVNKNFHPKTSDGVGYIVTLEGTKVYHAGDTDFIPEMKDIKADIALLPVSGTYVMTAEEASQAALAIAPKFAIPMHYGSIVGSASDAQKFKKLLEGKVEVKIL